MIIDLVDNGESGIRTHAPLRTNGFQDRLVMTTSISLRIALVFRRTKIIISANHRLVNNIFQFFYIFYLHWSEKFISTLNGGMRTFFIYPDFTVNCPTFPPPNIHLYTKYLILQNDNIVKYISISL